MLYCDTLRCAVSEQHDMSPYYAWSTMCVAQQKFPCAVCVLVGYRGRRGEKSESGTDVPMLQAWLLPFFSFLPPPPPLCQETKAHEATRNGSFFSFLYVKINVRGRVKNLLLLLPFPATSLRNVIRVCWPLLFPSPPPPFFLLPVVSLIKVMSTERKGGGGKEVGRIARQSINEKAKCK